MRRKVTCRKRRYRDKKEAVKVMHKRLTSEVNPPEKLYVYACETCGGCHLSRVKYKREIAYAAA